MKNTINSKTYNTLKKIASFAEYKTYKKEDGSFGTCVHTYVDKYASVPRLPSASSLKQLVSDSVASSNNIDTRSHRVNSTYYNDGFEVIIPIEDSGRCKRIFSFGKSPYNGFNRIRIALDLLKVLEEYEVSPEDAQRGRELQDLFQSNDNFKIRRANLKRQIAELNERLEREEKENAIVRAKIKEIAEAQVAKDPTIC